MHKVVVRRQSVGGARLAVQEGDGGGETVVPAAFSATLDAVHPPRSLPSPATP